jgi:hypothetical protein
MKIPPAKTHALHYSTFSMSGLQPFLREALPMDPATSVDIKEGEAEVLTQCLMLRGCSFFKKTIWCPKWVAAALFQ